MTPPISEIWVYLSASPLLGLTITLLAYQGLSGFISAPAATRWLTRC